MRSHLESDRIESIISGVATSGSASACLLPTNKSGQRASSAAGCEWNQKCVSFVPLAPIRSPSLDGEEEEEEGET